MKNNHIVYFLNYEIFLELKHQVQVCISYFKIIQYFRRLMYFFKSNIVCYLNYRMKY